MLQLPDAKVAQMSCPKLCAVSALHDLMNSKACMQSSYALLRKPGGFMEFMQSGRQPTCNPKQLPSS
eukprot:1137613-Pelagomonas_calceolata.AAC.14